MNKRKVVNDPVYGFISINHELIFDLINHPWFQRLRRIKQLGLTHMVYPGAVHTRFSHALGAMHLMQQAVLSLQSKGNYLNEEEVLGLQCAILMHDLGHGPFSHALESELIKSVDHENISLAMMKELNKQFNGALTTAINIFSGQQCRTFLHQLVSSQLDMDRMDYLNRDSYFSGVSEGIIGWDRIIKMLNVKNDRLVVEDKGIHSLEKFIVSRRIMYWQVYLHKTALAAELMIMSILRRARELSLNSLLETSSKSLSFFLETDNIELNTDVLNKFASLDDTDVAFSIKEWSESRDKVLSFLCSSLLNRDLYKLSFYKERTSEERIEKIRSAFAKEGFTHDEMNFLIMEGHVSNVTYRSSGDQILLMDKKGELMELSEASDLLEGDVSSGTIKKHYLSLPSRLRSLL